MRERRAITNPKWKQQTEYRMNKSGVHKRLFVPFVKKMKTWTNEMESQKLMVQRLNEAPALYYWLLTVWAPGRTCFRLTEGGRSVGLAITLPPLLPLLPSPFPSYRGGSSITSVPSGVYTDTGARPPSWCTTYTCEAVARDAVAWERLEGSGGEEFSVDASASSALAGDVVRLSCSPGVGGYVDGGEGWGVATLLPSKFCCFW